MAVMNELI